MPFVNLPQAKACYAKRRDGTNGTWDCDEFAAETDFKTLPKDKVRKEASMSTARLVKLANAIRSVRSNPKTPTQKRAVLETMLGGAAIGAPLGAMKAPKGHGWEGAGRGAVSGMFAGPGAVAGAGLGGLAGLGLGEGGKMLNNATGGNLSGDTMRKVQGVLGLLGVGGGALLGGKLGLSAGRSLQGKPSWEQDEGQAKAAMEKLATVVYDIHKAKLEKQAALKQLVDSLDLLAARLPATKQAALRTLQAELTGGKTMAEAIKVAFPMVAPEGRGILAYKFASFACKQAPKRKSINVPARDAGKAMHALTA